MAANLRGRIFQIFTKTHGLSLRSDSRKYLEKLIEEGNVSNEELDGVLEYIATSYRSYQGTEDLVEKSLLEGVISNIFQENGKSARRSADSLPQMVKKDMDPMSHFFVVNAFEQPCYIYDKSRRIYVVSSHGKSAFGGVEQKWQRRRARLEIVKSKALRDRYFSADESADQDSQLRFSSTSSLLGSNDSKNLIGYITQAKEGSFFLEDLDSMVELDLSEAEVKLGFITEGAIVIAEGKFTDGVFKVGFLMLPNPEYRSSTL